MVHQQPEAIVVFVLELVVVHRGLEFARLQHVVGPMLSDHSLRWPVVMDEELVVAAGHH